MTLLQEEEIVNQQNQVYQVHAVVQQTLGKEKVSCQTVIVLLNHHLTLVQKVMITVLREQVRMREKLHFNTNVIYNIFI